MGRSTRGGKMATSLRTMKLARRKRSETLVSNDLCSLLPVPRQTCSFDFVGHRSDGAIGTQVFEATLFCSLRDTTFHHFSRVTHSLLRWDKIHHLGAAFFCFRSTLFFHSCHSSFRWDDRYGGGCRGQDRIQSLRQQTVQLLPGPRALDRLQAVYEGLQKLPGIFLFLVVLLFGVWLCLSSTFCFYLGPLCGSAFI